MSRPIGATPQEWAGLAVTLGLEADLLPVVSNRARPVSQQSQLHANPDQVGKVPSVLNQRGEIAGMPGWSKHITTERDIARWAKEPDLGICIIGRTLKGIDIDVGDPAKAQRVRDLFEMLLGELPARTRGNSGKCLLAVRLPIFMPKWKFEVDGGVVEILGDNQQFIAVGTHPSGVRYEWVQGLPASVPEVSAAELQDAALAVYAALGVQGTLKQGREVLAGTRARHAVDAEDDAVEYLWGGGWVREEQVDGSLYVVCPWQHEHTDGAAGAPSATIFYPAGVGADKRGFKCLHAHCEGRTNREFLAKTGFTAAEVADEFEDVAPAAPVQLAPAMRHMKPWVSDVEHPARKNDSGKIESTAVHVAAYLDRPDLCGARIAFDEFRAAIMIEWEHAQGAWRPLRDTDYFKLRQQLERRGFTRPGTDIIREAVAAVAEGNTFDSAIAWLTGLEWDGVERCETFFSDMFGVVETPFSRAVGLYTWSALAGRVLRPGCKVDMVPTLIGAQGLRKTGGVGAMSPSDETFVELSLDTKEDDLARLMRGKLVGELGEMKGLSAKDKEGVKQWITRPVEEWTPKYKEFTVRVPRRLVLFGTGNMAEFLDDETGNRRWLPMDVVGEIDIARIEAERDQLWAEGRRLFCNAGHEVLWRGAHQLASAEHGRFTTYDELQAPIAAWLAQDGMDGADGPSRGSGTFRVFDVMTSALGYGPDRMDKSTQMRVAKILQGLGYEKTRASIDGVQQKVWKRKSTNDFC